MPPFLPVRWLFTLLSLALLAAAVYLLWSWYGYEVRLEDGTLRRVHGAPWRLWTGLGLGVWNLLGRSIVLLFFKREPREPQVHRLEGSHIVGADGAKLWVETYGPQGAPVIVFTHGWGMDSSIWSYAKAAFSDRYRLVMWDLPGSGRSKGPKGGKYTIAGFAADLRTVVQSTGAAKVVLVGHSIGGMSTLTLARDFPEDVARSVAGLVLVDTTYTNPLRTMILSPLWRALRWPVIEPFSWLQVVLSPLFHLMNWKSWLDGTLHLAMRLGFGSHVTRGQLDHAARLAAYNPPGVQAKGNMAMLRWDASDALPRIAAPVLILTGTRDIVTLPSASRHMDAAIRDSELVVVEGAGHMGLMDHAAEYNAAIGAFVARVLARA